MKSKSKTALAPATDRGLETYSEEDLAEKFTKLFPGTFAADVLGDPLDKRQARLLDAAIARRNVMELAVRAYGGGELSPWFVDRLDRALLTHAKLVGNLGERVVLMPADQVAAFLKEMKEDSSKEAVELIDAMPQYVTSPKQLKASGKP